MFPKLQIFVGGLPKLFSQEELREELQRAIEGAKYVDVILDRKTGKPKVLFILFYLFYHLLLCVFFSCPFSA